MWPWTEKAHRRMQRKSTAALCLILAVILLACSRNGPPNSLFESSGYHVRDGKVYYLNAFPGKAVEITDADPATFEALDPTYGVDTSHVYVNGVVLPEADAAIVRTARPRRLGEGQRTRLPTRPRHQRRPCALRTARRRALQRQSRRLLERRVGALRRPRTLHDRLPRRPLPVHQGQQHRSRQRQPDHRRRPGDIASPARRLRTRRPPCFLFRSADRRCGPFVIPSARRPLRHRFRTRLLDGQRQSTGRTPSTFRVLNANFECSADDQRAYYRQTVIAGADPRTFPPDQAVTNCSDTSISFAD